jgi:predicted CoA-substrate-specific enzyme activase
LPVFLDETGNQTDFMMNDKCAAGTGRFLEVMVNVMELNLKELGPISLKCEHPCKIRNTCTIFTESEVVSLRAEGKTREDLVAGVHHAMASRITIMASFRFFSGKVMFTGGVAKNKGMRDVLEKRLGIPLVVPFEPQIVERSSLPRQEMLKMAEGNGLQKQQSFLNPLSYGVPFPSIASQ